MKMTRLGFAAALGAAVLAAQGTAGKTHLKVGDTAPDFTFASTSMGNKPISLADFRGKKTVVLAFFPAAFTGG